MIKTFETFTKEELERFREDIKAEIEANKDKPKLKVGDIVDLDWGHSAEGTRIFAEVYKIFEPSNTAFVKSIICHRKPYLCDHQEMRTLISLTDIHKLANMEIFKDKMREPKIILGENDPYGEELWDDDNYYQFDDYEDD
jgi:hypothetical protein